MNAEDENSFKLVVKLPSINLDQRTALWELYRQTGAMIAISNRVAYTLEIVMPHIAIDALHADSDSQTAKIYQDIISAPPWSDLDITKNGKKLMPALKETQNVDVADLKRVVIKIIDNNPYKQDLNMFSKLHILNRFYFNVPVLAKKGERNECFGGWWVPDEPLYYPLVKKDDGSFIIIAGYTGAYMGPDYEPVQEFDYFNKKYGRRFKSN